MDSGSVASEARRLGFDLVGFVPTSRLDLPAGSSFLPSRIAPHLDTLVVCARSSYQGLRVSKHSGTRQFWAGRLLKKIDEAALSLALFLEDNGSASCPFSSLMTDYASTAGLDLTPAGQGSRVLRTAAVQAGLGTLGLNEMLLTPEFGPRVFLTGVLTSAELEGQPPLTDELCPGLQECGWCAAVCPAGAIPQQAPAEARLESVRTLDQNACAAESQPLGLARFRSHLGEIFESRHDVQQLWEAVGSRTTGALWQEMIMIKEGIFAGCSECVAICPVGADAAKREDGRRPPDGLTRTMDSGLVRIECGEDST